MTHMPLVSVDTYTLTHNSHVLKRKEQAELWLPPLLFNSEGWILGRLARLAFAWQMQSPWETSTIILTGVSETLSCPP